MVWRKNATFGTVKADHMLAGGVPVGGAGFFGNTYFVDYRNGSDGNVGTNRGLAFKTLSAAYSACTSNNNDRIIIDGVSAAACTALISWSKNRIHTYGDCGPFPWIGHGNGARVTIGVTTSTADISIITNTGVRNTFTGIKFDSGNTLTQAVYAFAEGGEYTKFFFCEFYKSTHLTTAAAAEVLCNGDSSQWYGCFFGDLVNARGGSSTPRPNVLLTRETIIGKVARDCSFVDCRFNVKALHADTALFYAANATDVERSLMLINPVFWNCILASATVADAFTTAAAQTTGDVLMVNPAGMNLTAFAEASHNVYVTGAVPTAATTGIAVEVAA